MSDTKLTPMQIVKEQPTDTPATTMTLATATGRSRRGRGLMPTRSAKFVTGLVHVLAITLFAIIAPI